MDNTNSPAIDLNIDPDLISPQDVSPQTASSTFVPTTTPVLPVNNSGIIDITPGSKDVFPSSAPVSNHIDEVPLSPPKTLDITPPFSKSDLPFHLTEIVTPDPTLPLPNPSVETPKTTTPPEVSSSPQTLDVIPIVQSSPEPTPPPTPPSVPLTPSSAPESTTTPQEPPVQLSPLAEDPDLVKLVK